MVRQRCQLADMQIIKGDFNFILRKTRVFSVSSLSSLKNFISTNKNKPISLELPFSQMSSPSNNPDDVAHQFFPFFKVYKDGRIERFSNTERISASDDSNSISSGFRSKDVIISSDPPISARIFLPASADPIPNKKLPLLFYVHGGGFCIGSAFDVAYHNHVGSLAAKSNVIAVSVEYRLAPEHPIPACYHDSWAALNWVAAHVNSDGPEPWLNDFADFRRVFMAGDSAGANICHYLGSRVGSYGLNGAELVGIVLVHPFFGYFKDMELWNYMCEGRSGGEEDPKLKPAAEDLGRIPCGKVLVFIAEEDLFLVCGKNYCEDLKKSGWKGTVEIVEHQGEGHVFHLMKPECEKADDLIGKLASFINQD